jgi:hypothetical protein
MTIGNLLIIVGILLFMLWSAYSITDYMQNSHNISYTTIAWLAVTISLFITAIIIFSTIYWDYKLF